MKRRLAVVGPLAVVAALAVGTGTASAAARQDFTLTQNSLTGPTTVNATGVINATGRDVQLSNTRDRFVFPAGNLIITHVPTTQRQSSGVISTWRAVADMRNRPMLAEVPISPATTGRDSPAHASETRPTPLGHVPPTPTQARNQSTSSCPGDCAK